MKFGTWTGLGMLVLALVLPQTAQSQCESQYFEPNAVFPELDLFGSSVDVEGVFAVVGSPGDDDQEAQAGAAYVYENVGGNWVEVAKLYSWIGIPNEGFGTRVALSGDTIVVGAPGGDFYGSPGSVYVFRQAGDFWLPEQRIGPEGSGEDKFGAALSLDGDALAIGAPSDDSVASDQGAAYVYRRTGSSWSLEQRLDPATAIGGDAVGTAVALFGSDLAVGAIDEPSEGQVYMYTFDGAMWNEQQELDASMNDNGDRFGMALGLQDDEVVVGAFGENNVGAVYVYERTGSTWDEAQRIAAPTGSSWFGRSLALDEDTLVIADPFQKKVHVYVRFGKSFAALGVARPSQLSERYGESVAIDGNVGWVGSPRDPSLANEAGRAYVLGLEDEWCDCLTGTVNIDLGDVANVLFVNGTFGGSDRRVTIEGGDPVYGYMVLPPAGGNGKYVVHLNLGSPGVGTGAELPFDIGQACFSMILTQGATPSSVWNNVGKTNLVGESSYFGMPIPSPPRATAVFLDLPTGDAANLPPGTEVTFQAITIDPGSESSKSASVSNAVILAIE